MDTITTTQAYVCEPDKNYILTTEGGGATISRRVEGSTIVTSATMGADEQIKFNCQSFGNLIDVAPTGSTVNFEIVEVGRI
jgi:hypothetical protein